VKEVVVERKDLRLSRSSNIAMWVGLAQIRLGLPQVSNLRHFRFKAPQPRQKRRAEQRNVIGAISEVPDVMNSSKLYL
jgi:hypothetical protein